MMPLGARQKKPLTWRKASFCASGECVEVAQQRNGMIVLRSSNGPRRLSVGSRRVRYSTQEWQAFVRGVKAGEFDDLR